MPARKKASKSSSPSSSSKDTSKDDSKAIPRLLLRTYRPTDNEAVHYLFTTTMFALVPEGVRRKLWSPFTWLIWLVGYGILLTVMPRVLVRYAGFTEPSMWMTAARVAITFCWALFGFSLMFIVTERFEMVDKVEQGLENDLKDPESIYLKYEAPFDDDEEDEKQQKQQKQQEHRPGHFWILLADDEPCGMLGLAPASDTPKLDQRANACPIWKQVARSLCGNRVQFGAGYSRLPTVIPSGSAHTATIVRWAVANHYQQCGLSSLLMHRAMTWAHEAGIKEVYAITNEVELAAEQILEKRHGFKLVRKRKIGWFGRHHAIWSCKVDAWMEVNGNHVNSRFRPKDAKKSS
ncbi:hypothetical protein DM01DRAFT_1334093 [Hesseltinella vesiculosa]|uniref:N-acetyltransferase domain-containing protein n=1 Tax=Hesseltinella vesiculosa TaxID=101127 RepID=A0A1X2GMY5_9FUNG|nr:hypothetical protein DM01DRAFT_1334093 [Hesseltinella vesiculosa]